jgi:hypothetical protein
MPDQGSPDLLYHWPAAAAFGRAVPKARFYEHGKVSAAVRQKFVDQVQRVVWAYKLADSTVRLQGTPAVPELQVFSVEAKGEDVEDVVLSAIDRTVHFPVIFEVVAAGRIRMVAVHKTLSGASPKMGTYFSTPWHPIDAERQALPTALDLPALYEALLAAVLPIPLRVGETVSAATDRMNQAEKLQREIAALEKRLRTEPQLNRKIDIRKQVLERQAALADLADVK